MRCNIFLLIVCSLGLFWSCSGNTNTSKNKEQEKEINADSSGNLNNTGIEIEPVISLADSVQVIFYDDPMGDSLRYSRYFTYVSTSDSAFLTLLKSELSQVSQLSMFVRKCRSEGKIYLFKNGEPIKTVFFSTQINNCRYLYFIKNGLFYYFDLLVPFSDELKKRQTFAIKP